MSFTSVLGSPTCMPGRFMPRAIASEHIEQIEDELSITESSLAGIRYKFIELADTITITTPAIIITDPIYETLSLSETITVVKVALPSIVENLIIVDSTDILSTFVYSFVDEFYFQEGIVHNLDLSNTVITTKKGRIRLPSPLFEDTIAFDYKIIPKRTMSGLLYTYVKKSDYKRLTYTFELPTGKAIELRKFLKTNFAETIQIRNYLGEMWQVVLLNPSFSFQTVQRGKPTHELHRITLEFSGYKLNSLASIWR